LYVARYGLHVRFRGEQQLRRDYGPILRSRGCVSPKDFQQLLGELEQEVARRQRLGQESAARKALISSSYHPVRPDVYNTLQVPGRADYWKKLEASRLGACLPHS